MINFKIYTLGCKVNQYDSGDLSRKMIFAGFCLVEKGADIAIINTCAVTKTAIGKCKRMINKARKENSKAKIVVMGCWPKVYKDEIEKLGVDVIWKVGELDKLVQEITKLCKKHGLASLDLKARKRFLAFKSRLAMTNRSRYFIKIQDGCEQFCSYCIIPYTRGKLRSRPMNEIISEVKQAIKSGYREVVLCGIHLGLYGLEGLRRQRRGDGERGLVCLLKKLIKIKDLGRVRLSSIEATEVNNELIKLIAGLPPTPSPHPSPLLSKEREKNRRKICRHLHIPLQSGCDKILKSMNRPYDVKYFKNKIRKIRKSMPSFAITTDVIVGFPGETEKDFQKTYNFIKEMKFSRLHVFPFSAHEKTTAFKIPKKVKDEKIKKRVEKLRKLGKKLEADYRKKFVGRELDVLVENRRGNKFNGKTEYYFDIEFDKSLIYAKNLIGKIIKVKS